LVFVSGQVGVGAEGNALEEFEAQARRVFDSIKALLESAGASMEDVVKVSAFLVDRKHFPTYNRVRSEYFKSRFPASTTVIVKRLVAPEYLVEVEAFAVIDRTYSSPVPR